MLTPWWLPGLEKLKNPNRSSIFSPQKRKLPNRFSVISVTVVCFHSVLFFSFKIQGASSLLAQRLTYQYCFNTCSININIGISIINSNFAPTVQTRHISSTFIFPNIRVTQLLKSTKGKQSAIKSYIRVVLYYLTLAFHTSIILQITFTYQKHRYAVALRFTWLHNFYKRIKFRCDKIIEPPVWTNLIHLFQ